MDVSSPFLRQIHINVKCHGAQRGSGEDMPVCNEFYFFLGVFFVLVFLSEKNIVFECILSCGSVCFCVCDQQCAMSIIFGKRFPFFIAFMQFSGHFQTRTLVARILPPTSKSPYHPESFVVFGPIIRVDIIL